MAGIALLCIDDDPVFGRFVQTQLVRRGYRVDVATDAATGLSWFGRRGFDVVALDHDLPGDSGLVPLDVMLAAPDAPPVIVLTGTSNCPVAISALKAGAAACVTKDLDERFIDALESAVHAVQSRSRQRREKDAADRETREARDRFEALAAERQILLHEVNHRVGNSLQLVGAFLHMQASSSTSAETRSALEEANRRVLAVAQVHRRLYATDDVQSIALGHYLHTLVDDIRQSTDAEGIGELLSFSADEVLIDPDSAVTIGVIVTELVINAMKYAYPGSRGPIRVSLLAQQPSGAFRLAVEDDGVGKSTGAVSPKGIGETIIRAMASKLETHVDYDLTASGTRASMTFKVQRSAAGPLLG